ncbi:Putative uncharacterized protein YeaK [Salmonella bongori]|nr:Putative uncharacterized protein YeaK [Salmonella bongori]
MNTQDYLRIARPELITFRRSPVLTDELTYSFEEQDRYNDDHKNGEKRCAIVSASRSNGSYILVSFGRQQ